MKKVFGKRKLIGSIIGLAVAGLAGYTVAQVAVAPGANKVKFPQGWETGVMYGTIDRPDTKQYREFYTSAAAIKAASAGGSRYPMARSSPWPSIR